MTSPIRRLAVTLGLAALHATASTQAPAAGYSAPIFNYTVDTTAGAPPNAIVLTPPAGNYAYYSVDFDWSRVAGFPYSQDAYWALSNEPALSPASTTYALPEFTNEGESVPFPVNLHWTGALAVPYVSGPLYFVMLDYPDSQTQWNNVTIHLGEQAHGAAQSAGSTAGGPLWTRPLEGGGGLSQAANATPYQVKPFYVPLDGRYEFEVNAPDFNSVVAVYADAFDPTQPLAHLVGAFDANINIYPDAGSAKLSAGRQYFLVTTGFTNSSAGPYTAFIRNFDLSQIAAPVFGLIPEPTSLTVAACAALGLAGSRSQRPRLGDRRVPPTSVRKTPTASHRSDGEVGACETAQC